MDLTFSIIWAKQFNPGCVSGRADLLSLSQYAADVVISRNVLWPLIHNKLNYFYWSVSCLLWLVNINVANEILGPS